MNPLVAVVIVAWNNYDDTEECIESIQNQRFVETQIFLVDNGSKIEPLDHLIDKYPEINYIRSEKNLGFAAGYNLGLHEALKTNSEYLLIVNNDTKSDSLMLKSLVETFEDESIGLAAPVIYYYGSKDLIWSNGGDINNFLLMPLNSHNRNSSLSQPIQRTFVSGCCYLLKREMLNQVGLFDERFFLYFEDLDFCTRVNKTEWKMIVNPSAKLYHKVSQSSGGQFSVSERYIYALSSGIYYRKHLSALNVVPVLLFRLGNVLSMTVRLLRHRKIQELQSYLKGLYDGWFVENKETPKRV